MHCNYDTDYQVFAVGSSNQQEGNTNLVGAAGNSIATGTAQSGGVSNWSMKLTKAKGNGTMVEDFTNDYAAIPSTRTVVMSREKGVEEDSGIIHDSFNAGYHVYVSGSQTPDVYSGQITYTLTAEPAGPFPTVVPTQPSGPMQSFKCAGLARGRMRMLTDTRDGTNYLIAKLEDGRCWMVENLRLGGDEMVERTLTSADSDIDSGSFTLPTNQATGFAGSDNDALYIDPGTTAGHEQFGGYYSWHTATAGTGTAALTSGDATNSICSKGWRLPTNDEYTALINAYGGRVAATAKVLLAEPIPHFTLGGLMIGNGLSSPGVWGMYWTSTAMNANVAYTFEVGASSIEPSQGDDYKRQGYNIRCIADE